MYQEIEFVVHDKHGSIRILAAYISITGNNTLMFWDCENVLMAAFSEWENVWRIASDGP